MAKVIASHYYKYFNEVIGSNLTKRKQNGYNFLFPCCWDLLGIDKNEQKWCFWDDICLCNT